MIIINSPNGFLSRNVMSLAGARFYSKNNVDDILDVVPVRFAPADVLDIPFAFQYDPTCGKSVGIQKIECMCELIMHSFSKMSH